MRGSDSGGTRGAIGRPLARGIGPSTRGAVCDARTSGMAAARDLQTCLVGVPPSTRNTNRIQRHGDQACGTEAHAIGDHLAYRLPQAAHCAMRDCGVHQNGTVEAPSSSGRLACARPYGRVRPAHAGACGGPGRRRGCLPTQTSGLRSRQGLLILSNMATKTACPRAVAAPQLHRSAQERPRARFELVHGAWPCAVLQRRCAPSARPAHPIPKRQTPPWIALRTASATYPELRRRQPVAVRPGMP